MLEMDMDWFCEEVYDRFKYDSWEYDFDDIDDVVSSPERLQEFLGDICWVEDYDFQQLADAVKEVYALSNSPALCYYDGRDNGYDVCLELSKNHTMWELEADEWSDREDSDYWYLVEVARRDFEKQTGTECLLLGRSGRHVCVEDNYKNAKRYFELCDLQRDLEDRVINQFNEEHGGNV